MSTPADPVSLAEWRRSVAELYADARASSAEDPGAAAARFRAGRDRMFREHAASPIPLGHRVRWPGASWFSYDRAWRISGVVKRLARPDTFEIQLAADGAMRCTRFGTVEFSARGVTSALALYWLEGYGGGLWLPFGDATNGTSTYGGGRYLYDTIKGADLGAAPAGFVLDFNFAYNPSCAYDDRWSCPLPPAENKLQFAVTSGERVPSGDQNK